MTSGPLRRQVLPETTGTPRPPPRGGEWVRAHRSLLIPVVLFLLAFAAYQIRVDHPPRLHSDEVFYVRFARNMTNGYWFEESEIGPRPQNFMHPPMGKLLIAGSLLLHDKPDNEYVNAGNESAIAAANGAYVYGRSGANCGYYNPACAEAARAWRLPTTLFGALAVASAYLIGLRLFGRVSSALSAAALLLLDGLFYLHARTANLEVFIAGFTLAAFAVALMRWKGSGPLAGILMGLAAATKLNSLFVLPVFLLVLFLRVPVPEADPAPPGKPLVQRAAWAACCGLLIPLLAYVASYGVYLVKWSQMGGTGFALQQFWTVQVAAFRFHDSFLFYHRDASGPLLWIPMVQPVGFWMHHFGHRVAYVWALGNPALWWSAAAALVVVPLRIARRHLRQQGLPELGQRLLAVLRRPRFPISRDLAFLVAALLFWCAYLPYFLLERTMFLYYMAYLVPFFAIFAGGLVGELWDRGGRARRLAAAYLIAASLAFLYYLPVAAGIPIDPEVHEAIMRTVPWMRS